jgi:PRD domain protein (TIGR03582 family)
VKRLDRVTQEQAKQSKDGAALILLAGFTEDLLSQKALHPDELQWKILVNHLDEMIYRSKTSEKLPELDITLFSGLSKKSMELADEVVRRVQNLGDDEQYLLAVHFENIQGIIT